jgi:hypothetical protein
MFGRVNAGCLVLVLAGALLLPAPRLAHAQPPAVVAYYPATPAIAYVPTPGGLFGLRTVYRPVVPAAVALPVVPAPVTTYYAPPAAAAVYYAPPAPVVRTYYPPASVTTYYAPAAPVVLGPPPVTVRYVPRTIVGYPVIIP